MALTHTKIFKKEKRWSSSQGTYQSLLAFHVSKEHLDQGLKTDQG